MSAAVPRAPLAPKRCSLSPSKDGSATVQAVDRALQILLCLSDVDDAGPTELGNQLELHKSTVYRLLRTLESHGFVSQDSRTDRYRIGPSILKAAQRLVLSPDIALLAQSALIRLRDLTGETAVLDVRVGDERICVAQAESQQEIRRAQRLAYPMPLHVGAPGRVLLLDASDEELRRLTRQGDPETTGSRAPSSVSRLRSQIKRLRDVGYAVSVGERVEGATSIAVPVRGPSNQVTAAMAVTGPTFRFTEASALSALVPLRDAADQLSVDLSRLGRRMTG